jgi:hypothetical protein
MKLDHRPALVSGAAFTLIGLHLLARGWKEARDDKKRRPSGRRGLAGCGRS